MKKFYLLAAVLVASSSVFAQRVGTQAKEDFSPRPAIKPLPGVASDQMGSAMYKACLLYTSDAADEDCLV